MSVVLVHGLHMVCFSQAGASLKQTKPVEFANVVIVDSLSKESLFQNAKNWIGYLAQSEEKIVLAVNDSIAGKIVGQSKFFVYSQAAGILKKLSGAITYNISLEVKDNKYRYRFSDFVFHYYKQDRYYNMVETGKTKPLEDIEASGWQKLWMAHKATTLNKMNSNIKNLEVKMAEKPKLASEKPEVKKVEW